MKKSISLWLLCAFCAFVLLGCGSSTVEIKNENTEETAAITEITETADIMETEEITETDTSGFVEETVVLTKQELEQWTDYVNSRENNAFLLSYYDEPKQMDLNELFYTDRQRSAEISGTDRDR